MILRCGLVIFATPEKGLIVALENATAVIHESVIGELMVGSIPNATSTLNDLLLLPLAQVIPFKELLTFIHEHKLMSKGLSWVDIHLLGSALAAEVELVTYDIALAAAWKKLR